MKIENDKNKVKISRIKLKYHFKIKGEMMRKDQNAENKVKLKYNFKKEPLFEIAGFNFILFITFNLNSGSLW